MIHLDESALLQCINPPGVTPSPSLYFVSMDNNDDSDFSDWDQQTIADVERLERQPRCTKCCSIFTKACSVRTHKRTCQVAKELWPDECDVCGKKFTRTYQKKKKKKQTPEDLRFLL